MEPHESEMHAEGLLGWIPDDLDVIDHSEEPIRDVTVVVVTEVGLVLWDQQRKQVTCYPRDGKPRSKGIWDRQPRPVRRADPLIPGEDWEWTERIPEEPGDPWSGARKRPMGTALRVTGVDF